MAQLNRTKNATRNIFFGVILKAYQIVVPFLMRTAMIYFMGVRYLGLNSLFISVMQVLNLAELGVGSALIYSMYKPIAEDDEDKICTLMKLYKTLYRIIGLIIAVVGVALTPFIPKIVNKDVPADINIYVLYLMNLSATVLSYWLFAYKNSILRAYQRTDVISKVTFVTNTFQYAMQVFVLWFFRNYYYYVIVILITQVLTNLVTAYFANKLYPKYRPRGQISKELFTTIANRAKDLMTSKIGGVVVDSVDSIVISAFLGMTVLAVYQNYFFVLNSLTGIISVLFGSVLAGIGNSIVVETKEKNYGDLKKFTFIICWIAGFCCASLLCLYQPFMELWVGKELMVDFSVVICFVVYFLVRQFTALFSVFKDAAGMWHEDRFRPLVSALINLSLNLLLVRYIGIYGIILSTIISVVVVSLPWLLHNLFTVLFDIEYLRGFVIRLLYYCLVIFGGCLVTYEICRFVQGKPLVRLLVSGVICCIIPNLFFFFVYRKQTEFKQMLELFNKMCNGRLSFLIR